PAHTRERRRFTAWNVYVTDADGRSAEPLLAVKFDAAQGQLFVTRAIYCYAWEGYDASDNIYLSRETKKWIPELVGAVDLAEFAHPHELREELAGLLFRAVVGASRLPLTSVEAPLPAFALGQLAYTYRPGLADAAAGPTRSVAELIERGWRTAATRV